MIGNKSESPGGEEEDINVPKKSTKPITELQPEKVFIQALLQSTKNCSAGALSILFTTGTALAQQSGIENIREVSKEKRGAFINRYPNGIDQYSWRTYEDNAQFAKELEKNPILKEGWIEFGKKIKEPDAESIETIADMIIRKILGQIQTPETE